MNRLVKTADGSNTLYNEVIGEHYHSAHGALQESRHVFIEAGLRHCLATTDSLPVNLLEVGFGTGLNFLLSFAEAEIRNIQLNYTGIEAYPLSAEAIRSTGYDQYVDQALWNAMLHQYEACFHDMQPLSGKCRLQILINKLENIKLLPVYDLVYYDAFSVRHQPEMWSDEMIAHTCNFLKPGGIFVSYAITGKLKRALKSAGFTIEKLPGAPGKREMIRGRKINIL